MNVAILQEVKEKLPHCHICGNLSDEKECEICQDTSRDKKTILVVQSPKDVVAMERTNEYHGVYHVLNGLISSSKGIMPEDLPRKDLIYWRSLRNSIKAFFPERQ